MTNNHELPKGWVETTIGDLYEIVGGGTPSTKIAEYWQGDIPWITSADVLNIKLILPNRYISKNAIVNSATNLVPKRSIVVVTRVGLGKIAITNFALCFSQDAQALVDRTGYLNPEFVLYYLSQAVQIFKYENQGTTISGVTKKKLSSLRLPLAPLAEQRRIVSKIEELFSDLDAGEANLRKAQKLIATYRQSVLKAAVTGELTRDWRAANPHHLESGAQLLDRIRAARRAQWRGRGKYEEPQPPDTRDLPELPEGWIWVTVKHLLIAPLSNGRSVPDREDGFPVLRLTALKNGKIDLTERKIGDWNLEDATPYLVRKGDFFVSRGNGSKKLVGRGGLVIDEPDAVAYPDTLIRIRTTAIFCLSGYLSLVWNSWLLRHQIEARAKTTAGIYKINQQEISSFTLPLPSLEEQKEIVNRVEELFSRIDALEIWCRTELARSTTLRQSILKTAFSGQLVPQDPNDEPTSALLERIRAGRAASAEQTPAKRGRRPRVTSQPPAEGAEQLELL